jgi:hypothetical protein
MSSDDLAPYERLARMIERELELVRARRFAELREAVSDRGAFLATLTLPPPPAAQASFERAGALHTLVLAETRKASVSIAQSLAALGALRRAAKGYAGLRRHRYSATA